MYDKRIFDNSRYNTFLKVTGNYESDLNNPQLTHDEIAKMIWYCQELQGGKMFIEDIDADVNTINDEEE